LTPDDVVSVSICGALLAPLYAWFRFTEGFATRDLQAAKALLVDLA
jgi:hypothetical protein